MIFKQILFKQSLLRQQFRQLSSTGKETPAEYCFNLVRNHDYENFLCTLLLPHEIKSAAFAIRAFNVEVALVEDRIKDKQIGLMRMNFWNKVIENVYNNKPSKIPVALELHRILKKHSLTKDYFKKLVDAREFKLTATKFLNIESMEKYAENSVSSVYYLILEANNIKENNVQQFASHVGKAQGIITLIRSVKYNAKAEALVLPDDLIQKNKLDIRSVLRGKNTKELRDTVSEIAEKAKEHINKAKSLKHHVKGASNTIFLPLYANQKYLNKLVKADFNVFDESLAKRDSTLALQLLWRRLINKPF